MRTVTNDPGSKIHFRIQIRRYVRAKSIILQIVLRLYLSLANPRSANMAAQTSTCFYFVFCILICCFVHVNVVASTKTFLSVVPFIFRPTIPDHPETSAAGNNLHCH